MDNYVRSPVSSVLKVFFQYAVLQRCRQIGTYDKYMDTFNKAFACVFKIDGAYWART